MMRDHELTPMTIDREERQEGDNRRARRASNSRAKHSARASAARMKAMQRRHAKELAAAVEEAFARGVEQGRAQVQGCTVCNSSPIVAELDGDFLCKRHADAWVRGEGRAQAEEEIAP